jgi:cell division protein FtsB
MQDNSRRAFFPPRPEGSSPYVTSAVGEEESFGSRRARRTSMLTRTIIWITALICLAFLLATLAQAWSNSRLAQQAQQAQQQLQQTQAHNAALKSLAQHYQQPSVIESEARQQLGYVRHGEHAVLIVNASSPSTPSAPHHAPPPAPQSFWQQWWNVFFGNS